jgi:hypothetical protein
VKLVRAESRERIIPQLMSELRADFYSLMVQRKHRCGERNEITAKWIERKTGSPQKKPARSRLLRL